MSDKMKPFPMTVDEGMRPHDVAKAYLDFGCDIEDLRDAPVSGISSDEWREVVDNVFADHDIFMQCGNVRFAMGQMEELGLEKGKACPLDVGRELIDRLAAVEDYIDDASELGADHDHLRTFTNRLVDEVFEVYPWEEELESPFPIKKTRSSEKAARRRKLMQANEERKKAAEGGDRGVMKSPPLSPSTHPKKQRKRGRPQEKVRKPAKPKMRRTKGKTGQ